MLFLATLVSCGGADIGTDDEKTTDSAGVDTTDTTPVTEAPYAHHKIENVDYSGETFTILYPDWAVYKYYFSDVADGDIVRDAAYNRIHNTMDETGITFELVPVADNAVHKYVSRSVSAGDDDYDMAYTHCIYGISEMVTEGYLYNVNDLPGIDLDAPWWDKKMIEYYRIGDNTYYLTGAVTLQDVEMVLFNKKIAEEFDLPDHYEAVENGTWTFDMLYKNAGMVSRDVDLDGEIGPGDMTGFAGNIDGPLNSVLFACGNRITEETEDGLALTFWSEKTVDIFEKAYDFFTDKEHSQGHLRNPDGQDFDDGLGLYTIQTKVYLADLRDANVDFGILPMPKYDEKQENYCNLAWSNFMCIPATVTRPELVGSVLEVYAYHSQALLTAYNDSLIREKISRDPQSREMLDLIDANITYDISNAYLGFDKTFMELFYFLPNSLKTKSSDFSSKYFSLEENAENTLAELYEAILARE